MPDPTLPVCRHRGAETAPTVYRCDSPKLVGLRLVTAEVCGACYCRDHEPSPEPPERPRLLGCVYLGQPLDGPDSVHACRHPDHRLHAPGRVPVLCRLSLPAAHAADAGRRGAPPPRFVPTAQPDGWWLWPEVQAAHAEAADDFLRDLEPYPADRYRGRGVVIVGGGKYFPSVYVTVRACGRSAATCRARLLLRRRRRDARRLAGAARPYGAHCTDLDDAATAFPFPQGWEADSPTERGWAAKVRAILDAPFEEVLFLDADSYPCRDPGVLFDHPDYRETGAVFWHDVPEDGRLDWEAFRVGPGRAIPSNRGSCSSTRGNAGRRCGWGGGTPPTRAATFRWGYGDKHACFQVPWAKLGRRYTWFADRGPWSVHAFLHPGPDGAPLFVHRCRDKFRLPDAAGWMTSQNWESTLGPRGVPLEAEAFGWMAELAHILGIHRGVLNLGCGNRPLLGGHNHDRRRHAAFVDTAHDLNRVPWPWPDATFAQVVADDVLEHLDDVVAFMDEAHRILKAGGRLRVRVPHYRSENAAIDPTHRRGFHPRSLDFFTYEGYGAHCVYTDRRWRIVRQWQEDIGGGPNILWELEPLSSPAGPTQDAHLRGQP